MSKLAVVMTTGDVYIIGEEDVDVFVSHGYVFGGYADTEEEAEKLAEIFCN